MSDQYNQAIYKVTIVSSVVNVILTLLKIVLGLVVNSISLISDGIHSLTDIITDIIVFVGVKWGTRPPDSDHHFGHGKFETFAELILALFILSAAGSIIWYGLNSITSNQAFSFKWQVVIIALVSVLSKEWLFRWCRSIASVFNSHVLLANAWHHRTDALSSLVVIIGAVFAFFNVRFADAAAGIGVGLMLAVTGLSFLRRGIMELSESAPEKSLEKTVRQVFTSSPEVRAYHKLRLRKLGSQLLMDAHIMVDPDINIRTAHDIATGLERQIKKELGANTNVLIHVEPHVKGHTDL